MRILCLCNANAFRSQIAAELLRRRGHDAVSAGLRPREIHWKTRAVLWEIGIEIDDTPKPWQEFAGQKFDLVVALSEEAAQLRGFDCERYLYVPISDPGPQGSRDDFLLARNAIMEWVEGYSV